MTRLTFRSLLCAMALAASLAATGAHAAAAGDPLPMPRGAKPMLEVALTDADLLPAIKQALPAIAAILPQILDGAAPTIDPAEVEAVFRDVQSIEAVYFAVAAGTPATVAQFYQGDLAEQGWRRLFWMEPAGDAGPQILIMSPPVEPGLFGVVVSPSGRDQQRTTLAFRVRGEIDVASLARMAVAFFTMRAAPRTRPPAEPPPAAPEQ